MRNHRVHLCSTAVLLAMCLAVAVPAQNSQEASDSSGAGGEKPSVPQKTEITRPSCFYTPWPQYTDEAKAAKYEGKVVLEGIIMTDGTVRNLRIVKWTGLYPSKSTYGLDQSVLTTMKRWKCKPAMRDGKPVPARVPFEITFRRDRSGW
jgi:TonB family protein